MVGWTCGVEGRASWSLTLTGLREQFTLDDRRGSGEKRREREREREGSGGGNTPKAKRGGQRKRVGEQRE